MIDPQSLAPLTTLGIEARARDIQKLTHEGDVRDWLEATYHAGTPRLVLGGGSNVVFTQDFPGSVGVVAVPGVEHVGSCNRFHYVQAGGGVNWHDFVNWTLDHNLPGLENLSLIPGSVGAAPMQNIGAYGVELHERFESLEAMDLETGERHLFERDACEFGYRDSRFKQEPDRWLILRVMLRLPREWEPRLEYAGLRETLEASGDDNPDPRAISRAVCRIRSSKLPDPARLGNVGSFFKNPIVDEAVFDRLKSESPDMPAWPAHDGAKLSAAWLIERCGWKGKRHGRAGVHEDHALVLVNHGGATGREVRDLAEAIRASVAERFGIQLETEPRIV